MVSPCLLFGTPGLSQYSFDQAHPRQNLWKHLSTRCFVALSRLNPLYSNRFLEPMLPQARCLNSYHRNYRKFYRKCHWWYRDFYYQRNRNRTLPFQISDQLLAQLSLGQTLICYMDWLLSSWYFWTKYYLQQSYLPIFFVAILRRTPS